MFSRNAEEATSTEVLDAHRWLREMRADKDKSFNTPYAWHHSALARPIAKVLVSSLDMAVAVVASCTASVSKGGRWKDMSSSQFK